MFSITTTFFTSFFFLMGFRSTSCGLFLSIKLRSETEESVKPTSSFRLWHGLSLRPWLSRRRFRQIQYIFFIQHNEVFNSRYIRTKQFVVERNSKITQFFIFVNTIFGSMFFSGEFGGNNVQSYINKVFTRRD